MDSSAEYIGEEATTDPKGGRLVRHAEEARGKRRSSTRSRSCKQDIEAINRAGSRIFEGWDLEA
ncbi:MAG: hypothetical protein WB392_03690 [Methanotrichaceae archaeon]